MVPVVQKYVQEINSFFPAKTPSFHLSLIQSSTGVNYRKEAPHRLSLPSLHLGYRTDMSRFIKYASNLLDGVDHIAKDSLTDQGGVSEPSSCP